MIFSEPSPLAREAKPSWHDVPRSLVVLIEDLAGAKVASADIAWGGYSPSASFRLYLADGRHLFVKGAHPGQTAEGVAALRREVRGYREIAALASLAPSFVGMVEEGAWLFLLLEHIDAAERALPWTMTKVESLASGMAAFYRRAAHETVAWARLKGDGSLFADMFSPKAGWCAMAGSTEKKAGFLSLFSDYAAAARWLDLSLPLLANLQSAVVELMVEDRSRPVSLLHLDLRSDNILFRRDGRTVVVDWPYVTRGPIVLDAVFFAPSVTGEGGPRQQAVVAAFERALGQSFAQRDQAIALAVVAGYFAEGAYQPAPPGLPRLRWIQRVQLAACLDWMTNLIGVPAAPPMRGAAA